MKHKLNKKLLQSGSLAVIVVGLLAMAVLAQSIRPYISFEAESGTRTGPIGLVADPLASGGQSIRVNSPSGGPSGKKCAVWLHGKGGSGGSPSVDGDVTWLSPTGNGDGGGWGPAHWEYATSTTFNQAISIINTEIAPQACGQIAIVGFSNGAAMAAKIFCQGQNFSGRLVGVLVDDPVPDQVVDNCAASSGVGVRLIMSDELGWITDGMACPGGWTCQGTLYGRQTYQAKLGSSQVLIKSSHIPSTEVYDSYLGTWWR